MKVYYNGFDPFAAAWLRELMKNRLIPDGEVDERSIKDVQAADVAGFDQCHFFAGIGGWAYALQLAGWGDKPVWTGSCPCQPFSAAGKGKGEADERHLWPEFARIIRECRPSTVFGEQVASKAGRQWLAGVFADLEGMGYRRAGADLCATGVGAPHIRQRLYWVADASNAIGRQVNVDREDGCDRQDGGRQEAHGIAGTRGSFCALADTEHAERRPESQINAEARRRDRFGRRSGDGGMGDTDNARSQGRRLDAGKHSDQFAPWASSVLIPCADGKFRRVPASEAGEPESAIFPLAHGIPNRVGALRGSGNAIVPQVAAEFVKAFCDARKIFGLTV